MRLTGLAAACFAALGLAGCGGSSSSGGTPPANPSTGYFIDSGVEGVTFKTATQNGTTGTGGSYKYLPGEKVTFSIGNIVFPEVTAAETITPFTMAGTENINNQVVVNIARLLQSLDSDNTPNNGITISPATLTATNGIASGSVKFDSSIADFSNSYGAAIQNIPGAPILITEDAAKKHLAKAQPIVGTWLATTSSGRVFLKLESTGTAAGTYTVVSNLTTESGAYTYADNNIIFTGTTSGTLQGVTGATVQNNSLKLTVADGEVNFERQISVSDQLKSPNKKIEAFEGIWRMNGGSGVTIFVFNRDLSYAVFSQYGTPGYEKGTYTLTDKTAASTKQVFVPTVNTVTDTDTARGFSGFTGEISFVVNENTLELTTTTGTATLTRGVQ